MVGEREREERDEGKEKGKEGWRWGGAVWIGRDKNFSGRRKQCGGT